MLRFLVEVEKIKLGCVGRPLGRICYISVVLSPACAPDPLLYFYILVSPPYIYLMKKEFPISSHLTFK